MVFFPQMDTPYLPSQPFFTPFTRQREIHLDCYHHILSKCSGVDTDSSHNVV